MPHTPVMAAVRSLTLREPPSRSELGRPVQAEAGLVERACSGDAAAFRAIFERHGPAVRRFLLDLLRDPAAADEATQETFVRAYRRLASIRDAERLGPWLFGIARNVFLEQLRARRTRPLALADSPDGDSRPEAEPVDTAPTPELALLGREADEVLKNALSHLSEPRCAALLLRLDHGLPYDEIADIMGWPLQKVKNEIHRARLQLRSQLLKYVGDMA